MTETAFDTDMKQMDMRNQIENIRAAAKIRTNFKPTLDEYGFEGDGLWVVHSYIEGPGGRFYVTCVQVARNICEMVELAGREAMIELEFAQRLLKGERIIVLESEIKRYSYPTRGLETLKGEY
jgi:hypothetical protein